MSTPVIDALIHLQELIDAENWATAERYAATFLEKVDTSTPEFTILVECLNIADRDEESAEDQLGELHAKTTSDACREVITFCRTNADTITPGLFDTRTPEPATSDRELIVSAIRSAADQRTRQGHTHPRAYQDLMAWLHNVPTYADTALDDLRALWPSTRSRHARDIVTFCAAHVTALAQPAPTGTTRRPDFLYGLERSAPNGQRRRNTAVKAHTPGPRDLRTFLYWRELEPAMRAALADPTTTIDPSAVRDEREREPRIVTDYFDRRFGIDDEAAAGAPARPCSWRDRDEDVFYRYADHPGTPPADPDQERPDGWEDPEIYDGYTWQDERTAPAPLYTLPCVACHHERRRHDETRSASQDDGLCIECRSAGRHGIPASTRRPANAPAYLSADTARVFAACDWITRHHPDAAPVLLAGLAHHSSRADRDAIKQWRKARTPQRPRVRTGRADDAASLADALARAEADDTARAAVAAEAQTISDRVVTLARTMPHAIATMVHEWKTGTRRPAEHIGIDDAYARLTATGAWTIHAGYLTHQPTDTRPHTNRAGQTDPALPPAQPARHAA